MAKLFLGLAIAVMLAAAVLGFLAKGNIDKLQSVLKETKSTVVRVEGLQRKAESELKKTQEDLTAANTKVEQQGTEISGLKSKNEELDKQYATVKADFTRVNDELEKAKTDLGKIDPNKPGMKLDEIVAELEQKRNDLIKTQTELAEAKTLVESLNSSNRQKEEQLASAQTEVKRYQSGIARNGLTGRVLAVNPGWNFVVLSVGDKQGAATGAMMVVTRGGEPIGKARITSVEPSTSIADVLPGTFRKGVSVQPGDVVVYEGSRAKPNALATPAPGLAPLPQ